MKTRLLTAAALLVAVLWVVPASAQAYEVVDTSAVRLTPEHTMMTITYRFGFLNREMTTPVFADRTSERRGNTVGYTLTTKDGATIESGKTAAMVFAKADLRDQQYYLPEKQNGEFTLIAFVRTTGITEDFKLALTRLPFTMIDGDVSVGAAVTADELKNYQTELVR